MRNVNSNHFEPFNSAPTRFILTMRNVNVIKGIEPMTIQVGFILTMRNVNEGRDTKAK